MKRNPERKSRPPLLEPLEPRLLLSTYTVSTLADSGPGSLRAAIAQADADSTPDTIQFQSSLAGTIALTTPGDESYGPSAFLITNQITIAASITAPGITITLANSASPIRLFAVAPNGNLTLDNLTLSGGIAQGGAGGSGGRGGGGGAAGLGGAIFNAGTLSISGCTFTANQALGGAGGSNGSYDTSSYGGSGGGGLQSPGQSGSATGPGGDGGAANPGAGGTASATGAPGGFGGGGGGGPALNINSDDQSAGNGGFGGGGGARGFGSGPGGNGGFGGGGGYGDPGSGLGGFAGGNQDNTSFGGGGGAGLGGAIFNDAGDLSLSNSTLTANSAQGGPGGGNAQSGSGLGGAIFNYNGALTVLNCSVSLNSASAGRGIYNLADAANSSAAITNTLLAQSDTAATDYVANAINAGTVASSGDGDLIRTNIGFGGIIVSTADPQLAPLANNGGPTQTMLPATNSPVIDAGDDSAASQLSTDQRGLPRQFGAAVDIGAVEDNASAPTITSAASATFSAGFPSSFTISTTGLPTPALSESGPLPAGLMFHDNGNGTATISGTPGDSTVGQYALTISASNNQGSAPDQSYALNIAASPVVVAESANNAVIAIDNPDGSVLLTIFPFPNMPQVTPRVTTADLNGIPVIIAAAGPGGGPRIKIFNESTGALINNFLAFPAGISTGLYVAAGDITGDGATDIIVGRGPGAGPRVRIFNAQSGALFASFFAYPSTFNAGVRVAVADVNADGFVDVTTAPGPGVPEPIKVFNGQSLATNSANESTPITSFYPFGAAYSKGVFIAAGPVGASTTPTIVASKDAGGKPTVSLFNAQTGALLSTFTAISPTFTGGVRVALADFDGQSDILAAPGDGSSAITIYSGADDSLLTTFNARLSAAPNGLFVA